MDMTTLRTIAFALTVLGVTGVVSFSACRVALRCVDLHAVPGHLVPRVHWWSEHTESALGASLTMLVLGLIGLIGG